MTARFEVGKTYTSRSSVDYDTIFEYTVVSRTAKFITVDKGWGEPKRVGVKVDDDGDDGEWALPEGSYSMAPVIRAARPKDQVLLAAETRAVEAKAATAIPAPFPDRLALALTAATMRFEARDGFLSDDDVLDITADWTTSDLTFFDIDDPDEYEAALAVADLADKDDLQAALFGLLTPRDRS